LLMSTDLSLHN